MKKAFAKSGRGIFCLMLILGFGIGCGKNDNYSSPSESIIERGFEQMKSEATSGSLKLKGYVVKGPVSGASVKFYLLKGNGGKGAKLGAKTTNAKGYFTNTFTPGPTNPVLVQAWGGSYVDEFCGSPITLNSTDLMTAIISVNQKLVVVTPFTHLASTCALNSAASGATLKTAINSCYDRVALQYNLPANFDRMVPVNPCDQDKVDLADWDQRNYGLLLAGLTQEANDLGVRAIDLGQALAEDLKDGILDGMSGSTPTPAPPLNGITGATPIPMPLIGGGTTNLPPGAGTTDLQNAINKYAASANNKTNLPAPKILTSPNAPGSHKAGDFYIATTSLPSPWMDGMMGYSASICGSNYLTMPYNCTVKSGALPTGLSLSSGMCCQVSGTPTLGPGAPCGSMSQFTVSMTNSAPSPATAEATFNISITAVGPYLIPHKGHCYKGFKCDTLVASATGGSEPYSFRQASQVQTSIKGAPPFGMAVNPLNGHLTGKPTQAGTYSFGVCVVDVCGSQSCDQTSVVVDELPGECVMCTDPTVSGICTKLKSCMSYPCDYSKCLAAWYQNGDQIWVCRSCGNCTAAAQAGVNDCNPSP